ncbi:MAG: fluoride efflux transporter CrcB [Dermatophilaceae bacterium]|nr:fluoride efflux transporter CrcB [Dermatophilaceae bacterium]NUR82139.1 fluoride efflux transporter CrcB [Dermatophilaceae bacterium]
MMLLLALAGGLGAVARFLADTFVARHNPLRMPLGTLLINVTGSLLLGFLTGLLSAGAGDSTGATVRAVLGTGFCGGYTTFSTASVESVRLWVAEGRATGVRYAAATLAGSVASAALGLWLGGIA